MTQAVSDHEANFAASIRAVWVLAHLQASGFAIVSNGQNF